MKIARTAPEKNPTYEKVPVMEKLEIKKMAVSKPSLKMAKNTTKNIPHDKGTIGVFLKGFFGYNSNPNIIEVVLWVLALMFGLNMWRRFYY